MRRLLIAGLLYLTGIAVLLVVKPQFMFRDDGHWKEFGIGRDSTLFTPFPFWLFAAVWAVVAYLIIMFLEDALYMPSDRVEVKRNNAFVRNAKQATAVQELVPGYYILNEGSTARDGVPRYVYLGPAAPESD